MSRSETFEKLKEIMAVALGGSSESVAHCTEDSDLITDLGLNSVGILYVVIAIEEFFSIRFDDVGFHDFQTVKQVIDYIEKKTSSSQS